MALTIESGITIGTGIILGGASNSLTIGTSLGGGIYIGTTTDTGGTTYNLIMSPKASGDLAAGGAWPEPVKNLLGTGVTDGYQNTEYIRTYPGNTTSGAAWGIHALRINGYTDWYWPSRDEITTMLAAINSGLLPAGEAPTTGIWSSSIRYLNLQYYAYAIDLTGNQIYNPPVAGNGGQIGYRVRAVRRQLP
jgi:hypothetical protein